MSFSYESSIEQQNFAQTKQTHGLPSKAGRLPLKIHVCKPSANFQRQNCRKGTRFLQCVWLMRQALQYIQKRVFYSTGLSRRSSSRPPLPILFPPVCMCVLQHRRLSRLIWYSSLWTIPAEKSSAFLPGASGNFKKAAPILPNLFKNALPAFVLAEQFLICASIMLSKLYRFFAQKSRLFQTSWHMEPGIFTGVKPRFVLAISNFVW